MLVVALVGAPVAALAHAVVFPGSSTPGAYEKYVLRVPNERNVATVRVALAFPETVTVVSFADVVGWSLEIVRNEADRITGAVWTGELPVGRFVEFPFVAVNPRAETRLRWNAIQTYAGGEVVEWSGPEDSATPASFTTVRASDEASRGSGAGAWLGATALVLALLSLGLALRGRSAA